MIKGGKYLPKRSNTNVRRVTEGIGIIVAGCCAGITDIPSSVSVWGDVKCCIIGPPELMTVVMAEDIGIFPRIWSCSVGNKGEGIVIVLDEENLTLSEIVKV